MIDDEAPKPIAGWKAAILIAVIAGFVFLTTRQPTSRQALGTPAPALALTDLAGKPVSLADYKGKVVLLNFWATWCEPCQEEIPDLIALQKKYESKGFTVIGVSMDGLGKKLVEPFIAKNKVTYPIWLAGGDNPPGYDVPGLPTSYLIDSKGRVAASYIGGRSGDEFERDIQTVLGN